MFPKIGVPQNGWFIVEIPSEMDDLGGKPTIFGNIQVVVDKLIRVIFQLTLALRFFMTLSFQLVGDFSNR